MKLALGAAQFGLNYGVSNASGKVDFEDVVKVLNLAKKNHINTIDTAISYGDSEEVLGRVGVDAWEIVSKLPEIPEDVTNIENWIYTHISNSLNKLNIKSLYALLLHRPSQLLSKIGPQIYATLKKLKSDGIVKKIGVSVYSSEEFFPLFKSMHFDIVQCPFNILDHDLVSSGWLYKLKSLNVEIHIRSVFLQGLLLMSKETRPAQFLKWNEIWTEWDRWLSEVKLSPLEACLRYVLSVQEIDKIVVGVNSPNQLHEILKVNNKTLESLPLWPQNLDHRLINPAYWS